MLSEQCSAVFSVLPSVIRKVFNVCTSCLLCLPVSHISKDILIPDKFHNEPHTPVPMD